MTKTGFCGCLRPVEGDNDIDGPYGHRAGLLRTIGVSKRI
jgi:hypothetical protein